MERQPSYMFPTSWYIYLIAFWQLSDDRGHSSECRRPFWTIFGHVAALGFLSPLPSGRVSDLKSFRGNENMRERHLYNYLYEEREREWVREGRGFLGFLFTKLGGNSSYKPPELPIQLRDLRNNQKPLNTILYVSRQQMKTWIFGSGIRFPDLWNRF